VITKRPSRLAGVSYVGFQRYSVTACTAYRRRIFTEAAVVDPARTEFHVAAAKFEFEPTVSCFMPDHVHLPLIARSEQSDFCRCIKQAKQKTGFAYRQRFGRSLWQPGYHERILRDDEETLTVVRYILENPIRAGLAKALGEYPFASSAVYTLDELLAAWERQEQ
jgi:REP element-mobilizing transposase RayT